MLSRREFMILSGLAGLSYALPSVADETKQVSVIVDSFDSRVMEDFKEFDDLSIIGFSSALVGEYFAEYGVRLNYSFDSGNLREETEDIRIFYTTQERMKQYYSNNPEQFIIDVYGQAEFDRMDSSLREKADQMGLTSNPFFSGIEDTLWDDSFEKLWGELELEDKGGHGLKHAQKAYVLSEKIPEELTNREIVNYMAFIQAHELGHVFGLEHNEITDEPNLMCLESLIYPEKETFKDRLGTLITGPIPNLLHEDAWKLR